MNSLFNRSVLCAFAVLAACIAHPGLASADSVTFVGQHYEGVIAQIDDQGGAGSITTRFAERTLPFKLTSTTRIWKTQRLNFRDLQVGSKVLVIGRATKSADTVQPVLIDVLPALPQDSQGRLRGQRQIAIFGSITSIDLNPVDGSIAVRDRSGSAYTLPIAGLRPLIGQTVLGSVDDLTLGTSIKIDGKMDASAMVADRIVLQVDLRAARNGRRMRRGAARAAPQQASAPAPAPNVSDEDFGLYDLL